MSIKRCSDLYDLPGFPGCCTSCHEDADKGYVQLCGEHYDKKTDVLTHVLCCRVSTWLRKQVAE